MKITIELTDVQVKGIKKWNLKTGGDKWRKKEIEQYIFQIVHGYLECEKESVSWYIKEFGKQNYDKENNK